MAALLRLTPTGRLRVDDPEALRAVAPRAARDTQDAQDAATSSGALLLDLAVAKLSNADPALYFWGRLGRAYLDRLSARGELGPVPRPTDEDLAAMAAAAPPLAGGDHLGSSTLAALWTSLDEAVAAEREHGEGLREYLHRRAPAWHEVGRVHLHLAERKDDPERPFAFLATFTDAVGAGGAARHRRLADALKELGAAGDQGRLDALLEPVRRAAEGSPLIRELLESCELFHPLAWTAAEAHRLLVQVPALEHAGLVLKVPDWWARRPRVQVQVTVGEQAPSRMGLDALVRFSSRLAVDGEPLTAAERARLLEAGAGLALIKGRWVEADRERLQSLLGQWDELAEARSEGLTLREGLQLLAGAPLGEHAELFEGDAREWTTPLRGEWLRQRLDELRQGERLDARLRRGLQAELRAYQRVGVAWLETLTSLGLGACLADDMGLGKTVQVLAWLLASRKAHPGPALVVAPASLLANWAAEAARFVPGLSVLVAHPSALSRKQLGELDAEAVAEHDLVLTSYGYLRRLEWTGDASWSAVVLDEAQAIKNPGTRAARAVKALETARRVALTGTPVENRAGDLWSLMDFLNPGLLGGRREFTAFLKRLSAEGGPGYAPLRRLVQPYLLRRRKSDPDIAPELPAKTEVRAHCALTRRQAALYEEATEELADKVKRLDGIERRGLVLQYLMRLQQICNHPSQWLGDGEFAPGESGKLLRLGELLEPVAARQEKALVFTRFRSLVAPLAAFLEGVFQRPGLVLDGATPVRRRGGLVERFQDPDGPPFMVLTVKAGGTGLNLTAASHVVHFDRWWNPAVEEQATDRAYRIGQRKAVLVHKLICRGTLEERLDVLLQDKAELARDLLSEEGARPVTELDDEALLNLVRLDIRGAATLD